jgi:hypothetical protein
MKVAGWCEAHYIDLMPHNPLGPVSTAACIHLGAAVPNFAYLEDNFSEESMHSQWDTTVFPKLLMRETTMVRQWERPCSALCVGQTVAANHMCLCRCNRSATPRLATLCRLTPVLVSRSTKRHLSRNRHSSTGTRRFCGAKMAP